MMKIRNSADRHIIRVRRKHGIYIPSHTGRNNFTFNTPYPNAIPNGIFDNASSENFKTFSL